MLALSSLTLPRIGSPFGPGMALKGLTPVSPRLIPVPWGRGSAEEETLHTFKINWLQVLPEKLVFLSSLEANMFVYRFIFSRVGGGAHKKKWDTFTVAIQYNTNPAKFINPQRACA